MNEGEALYDNCLLGGIEMQISEYLVEIRHAVEVVMSELHRERDLINRLEDELAPLAAAMEDGYRRVEFLAQNPDLDDDGLGTAIYWDTYFGSDKDRYYKAEELEKAQESLEAHRFSIAAMAGSLLQYAKQGIVLHYGIERIGCPDGRTVAGMPLHEVIWQGRNQAIHWEEGELRSPVERCFKKLAEQIDQVYQEFQTRSMAYDIICLLGWYSFDDFANDMRSIR